MVHIPSIPLPSTYFSDRPRSVKPDTIVIHSMYNPDAPFPFDIEACRDILNRYGVSSHFIIDREGGVYSLVDVKKKAYHAGISVMPNDGRENVNDFSIGIELIGNEISGFTDRQYEALEHVVEELIRLFDIRHIYGHQHIAPDRKSDPWNFDWNRFLSFILRRHPNPEILTFPDGYFPSEPS